MANAKGASKGGDKKKDSSTAAKKGIVKLHMRYKDGKAGLKSCPKCGRGVFMASHKGRCACGKCGYTEFARKGDA